MFFNQENFDNAAREVWTRFLDEMTPDQSIAILDAQAKALAAEQEAAELMAKHESRTSRAGEALAIVREQLPIARDKLERATPALQKALTYFHMKEEGVSLELVETLSEERRALARQVNELELAQAGLHAIVRNDPVFDLAVRASSFAGNTKNELHALTNPPRESLPRYGLPSEAEKFARALSRAKPPLDLFLARAREVAEAP